MTDNELTSEQANALFNILTHHEAYQELRDLRRAGALAESGAPWKVTGNKNQAPLFQNLLLKVIVALPGLRDVKQEFWQVKVQELIDDIARDDLSESYEAGYIGVRKTLATAAAAAVEGSARGLYGGFPKKESSHKDGNYDLTKAEDIFDGFQDILQGIVYGDLLDKLFDKVAETDKLEDHDNLTKAAHEYMLVIAASFMHYILVMSAEGPTLFSMMKTANSLVPYLAIKQTLRIGNVAAMINGMMKIVLAKISLNTVTTFIGLTNASDAGMNLMQNIISTVVNWDTSQLKSRAAEIARKSDVLSKAQRECLEKYIEAAPEEREKCRTMSIAKVEPIVVTIMDEYGGEELSAKQIPQALEYLSLEISIKDRQKIVSVLCSRQPDLLTQACREGVAAYDPVIRSLHKAVDLSGTVGDLSNFLQDLFALPISNTKDKRPPTVEDFVHLLRKHQGAAHKFIHQICKNGPEMAGWYKDYARSVAALFRIDASDPQPSPSGAGKLTIPLQEALSHLSTTQRSEILTELNAHATYLQNLTNSSHKRMKDAINTDINAPTPNTKHPRGPSISTSKPNSRATSPTRPPGVGPGIFLRRWQAYINETEITPCELEGGLRWGGDKDVVDAGRSKSDGLAGQARLAAARSEGTRPPVVKRTVELLGGKFRELLREANESRG